MYFDCSFSLCVSRLWVLPVAFGLLLAACNGELPEENEADPAEQPYEQTLTPVEEGEGFVHLFDGTDLQAWRGFQQEGVPEGWQIDERGALIVVEGDGDADLITRDTYENFDLRLDFWVGEGSNSGIFYMVAEDDYEQAWHTGPEYQLLDDHAFEDANPEQLTATNYDVMATDVDAFQEAGTWQSARIVKDGNTIQHWLNDDLVLTYEVESPEWHGHVEQTKFVDYPGYGQYSDGHIGLQHYGDDVRFRNIRIHTW